MPTPGLDPRGEARPQADHELKISAHIERVILQGTAETDHLLARVRELEAELAEARGDIPPQPPKLLTFGPGPLPSRMDGEIVTRVVDVIKAKCPAQISKTRKPFWTGL